MSSTIPTWTLYVFFGIVVPIVLLVAAVTSSDVISISNVSILCITLILHNNMFHITLSPATTVSDKHLNIIRMISICIVGVMCCILFGVPDYVTPSPPVAPVLSTGNCHPYWIQNVSSADVCHSFRYYTAMEAESREQFAGTSAEGTKRDNALQHGIQQILGAYGKIVVSTWDDALTTDEYWKEVELCPQMFEDLACSVMFPPCSGDCSRSVRTCRKACLEYITSCSHSTRMYELMGPTSTLRPLLMPSDPDINPVYYALDRLMLDFKQGCTNDSRYTDDDTECGGNTYQPLEAGNCNDTTRGEILSAYTAAQNQHLRDVDNVEAHRKLLHNALYGMYFVMFLLNVSFLWMYTLCVVSRKSVSDGLREG
eukprot:PhF_6_TR15458/c0_g1_i1/m.24030